MSKGSKIAQVTSSNASSRMIWPVHGTQDGTDSTGGFTRLEDPISVAGKDRWGRDVNIQGGKNRGTTGADDTSLEEINASHKGIRVQREITIVSEAWDYNDRLY